MDHNRVIFLNGASSSGNLNSVVSRNKSDKRQLELTKEKVSNRQGVSQDNAKRKQGQIYNQHGNVSQSYFNRTFTPKWKVNLKPIFLNS